MTCAHPHAPRIRLVLVGLWLVSGWFWLGAGWIWAAWGLGLSGWLGSVGKWVGLWAAPTHPKKTGKDATCSVDMHPWSSGYDVSLTR